MAPRAVTSSRWSAACLLATLLLLTAGCDDTPLTTAPISGCTPDDSWEENDAASSATPVGLGAHSAMGCIADDHTDPDFYVFAGRGGRTYRINLEVAAGAEWNLALHGVDGAVAVASDGAFTMPSGGRVTIEVSAKSKSTLKAGGEYRLVLAAPNASPSAQLTFSPQAPEIGDAVQFQSTSTDADGDPLVHSWRFPDGTSLQGITTAFTFTDAGTHGVRLIVADDLGARDSTTVQVPVKASVFAVELTPSVIPLATLGDTVRIQAAPRDRLGRLLPARSAAWSTSAPSVATVRDNGLITATGNGSAVITARIDNAEAQAAVVVAQKVGRLVIAGVGELDAIGATAALTASASDARGNAMSGVYVEWGSSNPAVAEVDGSGVVTARANGSAIINATAAGVRAELTMVVRQRAALLAVAPASTTLEAVGDTVRLQATARDGLGHAIPDAVIAWASSDAAVQVDANGYAWAVQPGSAIITAVSGEAAAQAIVAVTPRVASIEVAPAEVVLGPGQTVQLTATARDRRGRPLEPALQWRSADENVAAVTPTGLVTAVGAGRALVSASADGAEGSALIIVQTGLPSRFETLGSGQTGTVGVTLAQQLAVRVLDVGSQPVAGVAVTFTTAAGSLAVPSSVTDAEGWARTAWTLGTVAGAQSASATVGALGNANFAATALPGAAASIMVVPDSATIAVDATVRFSAQVRDAFDNLITGAALTWSTGDPDIAQVDGDGLAIGRAEGTTTVTVSAGAVEQSVPLVVTAGGGGPGVFTVTGSLQVGHTATAAPDSIVIEAFAEMDCSGEVCVPATPVPGARFQLHAQRGTLSASTVTTAADGRAFVRYTHAATFGEDTVRIVSEDGAQHYVRWNLQEDTAFVRFLAVERLESKRFTAVAATSEGGSGHTCALTDEGIAYCWGVNNQGQLGIGSDFDLVRLPVRVAGDLRFSQISGAGFHTCGVTTDGVAYCWGDRDHIGSVGDGPAFAPVAVQTPERFTRISAGQWTTCAISTTGHLWCWGDGAWGTLADGSSNFQQTPVPSTSAVTFTDIAMGTIFFGCALATTGDIYCWGANHSGQLGDGTLTTRREPVRVTGDHRFTRLSAFEDHACAVRTDGAAYCWGYNPDGVLGNGQESRPGFTSNPVPQRVLGTSTYNWIATGMYHTCAIGRGDGAQGPELAGATAVFCWGANRNAQFGNGSILPDEQHEPVPAAGAHGFTQLSAGSHYMCGIKSNGELWCWGQNVGGELGTGSLEYRILDPVRVGGGGGSVRAGGSLRR